MFTRAVLDAGLEWIGPPRALIDVWKDGRFISGEYDTGPLGK